MNKRVVVVGLSLLSAVLLSGCVSKTVSNGTYTGANSATKYSSNLDRAKKKKFKRVTYGKASWYGKKFDGKKTASGEIFSSYQRTGAHRTLPFNTMVRVTDMVSGRSTIVRINDRGPFSGNRIIDLSFASANKIGLVKRGVTDVKIEIVGSNSKVDRRLLSLALPTSNKACVGDDCKASISTENRVKKGATTWSNAKISKMPVIESVVNVIESDPYASNLVDTYSQKVSVQVGAFRKLSGAKLYLRRYSMLSNQHKAIIKNGDKDAKPIYRVQIEGFGSEIEARGFISKHKHRLNGAFLVRR